MKLDWAVAEARAERMSDAALWYAKRDALESARVQRGMPEPGPWSACKGEGYYYDEASVYARELARRRSA